MAFQIPADAEIECPWCNKRAEATHWNNNTKASCLTREQRRAFKEIYDPKQWKSTTKSYYKCPNCGQWIKGNSLRLEIEISGEMRKIGYAPIMRLVNRP